LSVKSASATFLIIPFLKDKAIFKFERTMPRNMSKLIVSMDTELWVLVEIAWIIFSRATTAGRLFSALRLPACYG